MGNPQRAAIHGLKKTYMHELVWHCAFFANNLNRVMEAVVVGGGSIGYAQARSCTAPVGICT